MKYKNYQKAVARIRKVVGNIKQGIENWSEFPNGHYGSVYQTIITLEESVDELKEQYDQDLITKGDEPIFNKEEV
jgi:uncharacterized protein Yka (UPF0111/DUF47 family)